MWAYEYRNHPFRPAGRIVEDGVGPYRLRQGKNAFWQPPGIRPRKTFYQRIRPRLLVVARLAVPVLLLMVLLAAVYLYMDQPVGDGFVSASQLAVSDLVLPIAFFAINLTNRRYGADHAFAQLMAGLGLCAMVLLFHPEALVDWLGSLPRQSLGALLSFGIAFLAAGLAGIALFELGRGPRWWLPPLLGSAATSLVFSLVYFPAAGLKDWGQAALSHAAAYFAESVGLLLPYFLLRAAMRPVDGLNGY